MPPRTALAIVVVVAAGLSAWLVFFESASKPATEGVRAADENPADRQPAALATRGREATERGARHSTTSNDDGTVAAKEGHVVHRGVVLGPGAKPAVNALVVLVRDTTRFSGRTNARGRFRIDVPPGRYAMTITSSEVGTLHRPAIIVDGAVRTEPLRLVEGPPLNLHLTRGTQALVGARVHVVPLHRTTQVILDEDWWQAAGRATHVLTTTQEGIAHAESVPPGSYTLFIEFAPTTLVHVAHDHESDKARTIAMLPPTTMRGRITDGWKGRGIADADVKLSGYGGDPETSFVAQAKTAGEGRFALELPRSQGFNPFVQLRVEAKGYSVWSSGGLTRSDAALVKKYRPLFDALYRLPAGAPGELHVPLRYIGRPSVTGRVVDDDGAAVPGVNLVLHYASSRRYVDLASIQGDADGRFEIERLAPNRYAITVTDNAWYGRNGDLVIPHEQADSEYVEVRVTRATSVTGRVVLPDGRGVAGAQVWIARRRHPSVSRVPNPTQRTTAADGGFSIGGLSERTAGSVRARWGTLQAMPIYVSAHRKNRHGVRLVLQKVIDLRGRVIERGTGRPVPKALVRFDPTGIKGESASFQPGGRSKFSTICDIDGVFHVESLLPGMWRLAPWSSGYLRTGPALQDWRGRKGIIELNVELDQGLVLTGRVENGAGEPIAAKLSVGNTQVNAGNGKAFPHKLRDSVSEPDGTFRIVGLPVEPIWMTVWAQGYAPFRLDEIDAMSGPLQIVLKPLR